MLYIRISGSDCASANWDY